MRLVSALLLGAAALHFVSPAAGEVGIESIEIAHEGLAYGASVAQIFTGAPQRPWLDLEVVSHPLLPLPVALDVDHDLDGHAWFAVQSVGIDDVLRAAFFRPGGAASPVYALRDRQTLAVTPPASMRQIALEPSDPSGTTSWAFDALTDSDGAVHAFATAFFFPAGGGVTGWTEVIDYREGGVNARTTRLVFEPNDEPLWARFAAHPDGSVWAVFAGPTSLSLFELIDPQGQIVADPIRVDRLAAPPGFDPRSVRLGIIAILIGLVETPVAALSYQGGDDLILQAYDGMGGFLPVTEQPIPAGAAGLIEEEGIFYTFTSDDLVFRGRVGALPDARVAQGDVASSLDETSLGTVRLFESAGGDAQLDVAEGWMPPAAATEVGTAAARDAVTRSTADLDLVHSADGRRAAVVRGVLPSQAADGRYEASGARARSYLLDVEQMPFGDVFAPATDAMVAQSVNPDLATRGLFVFDDTDGAESISVVGIPSRPADTWQWVDARSYRAEVVPWLWLLPGASASVENEGSSGRLLRSSIHEAPDAQSALAVTPASFAYESNDASLPAVQSFAAGAAAALGAEVEVLAFASLASRTESVDKDETISIGLHLASPSTGEDLHFFWGGGLDGSGVVDVAIEVENDETHWVGVDRQLHGSIEELGPTLAGSAEPLLAEQPWNRLSVTFEAGDPDRPIVLGATAVGVVRVVPEPGPGNAAAAACLALLGATRRLRSAGRRWIA